MWSGIPPITNAEADDKPAGATLSEKEISEKVQSGEIKVTDMSIRERE